MENEKGQGRKAEGGTKNAECPMLDANGKFQTGARGLCTGAREIQAETKPNKMIDIDSFVC
jgi:hypothetical protein